MARFAVLLILLLLPAGAASALDGIGTGTGSDLAPVRSLVRKEAYREAVTALESIIGRDLDNADAWNLLGFSHRKLKAFDSAERAYTRALSLDSDHKGALEYLGELYVETNRPDAARKLLARLERLCPLGCDELSDLRDAVSGRPADKRKTDWNRP